MKKRLTLVVAGVLALATIFTMAGCGCQTNTTKNETTNTTSTTNNATDMTTKFNEVFKDYTIQDLATAVPSMKSAFANATGVTMLVASDNADVNKASKAYILVDGTTAPNGFDSKAGGAAMNASYERSFGAPTSKTDIDGNEVTWYKAQQGNVTVYMCAVVTDSGFVTGMGTDEDDIVNNMNKLGLKVK